MKFRISFLFLLVFVFTSPIFSQQEVILPTHQDGSPIICEKFEMLKNKIPFLLSQQNLPNEQSGNTSNIPLPPELQAATRMDDTKVGQSGKAEFEVHAAINPFDPSNIIVGAMSITDSGQAMDLKFSVYHTNDFGTTWSKSPFEGVLPTGLTAGGGDPMIVFDENGTAYFSWVLLTIDLTTQEGGWGLYLATSTDGGANWTIGSSPIELNTFTDLSAFSDLETAVDKPWMKTDHSPISNFTGNIYANYVVIDIQSGKYNMKVKRRLAGNANFEDEGVIISTGDYSIVQFASIDVGIDGVVYATFLGISPDAVGGDYTMYVAKSTDGGATFGTEQKVSNIAFPELVSGSALIPGISEDRLYPCPHVATDPTDAQTVYATWTAWGVDEKATDGLDIYISSSTDGGTTWSAPTVVNNDTDAGAHQFYSSLAISEAGVVLVSWYDQRDAQGTDDTNYYLGFSGNGGTTFEQINVTSVATDFGEIADNNLDIGPGEYNQIVTTGVWAIPFWGDGRAGGGNVEVWSAFINIQQAGIQEIKSLNTNFSFIGPKPNPIKEQAVFELNLKKTSNVEVLLFDVGGKLLRTIVQQKMGVGNHTIEFKTKGLAVGEYFVTLNTDFGFQTEKIIIVD